MPADLTTTLRGLDPVLSILLDSPGVAVVPSKDKLAVVVAVPRSNRNAGLMGLLQDRQSGLDQAVQKIGIRFLVVRMNTG